VAKSNHLSVRSVQHKERSQAGYRRVSGIRIFFGNTGPLELYGYVDFPKDLDIGNANSTGIWDGGSRFFAEIEPRLSFGKLLDRDLTVGPIKDWLIAVDYTFDDGSNGSLSRSANLNIGLGTTIDFGIPLRLQANFYERYWGENYGRFNSNSWDGYRAQFVYSYPIMKFADGSTLSYGGYTNIDFDSKLHNLTGNPNTTSDMLKSTHGLIYKLKHYSFGITAQYYEHGGQSLNSTGWAGLAKIGYRF
jgi:nucleoside-specific channel-forming protein